MTKTTLDVVKMACRRIKILSVDEVPSADQYEFASEVLASLFAEVKEVHGMPFTWTTDTTPDAAFLPLSYLLAVEIAPHYGMPTEPRSRAMGRLRAYAFPDDRTDSRDLDDDGTVSTEEAAAAERALYY